MIKKIVLAIFTIVFFTVVSPNQLVQAEDIDPIKMVEISRNIEDMSMKDLEVYISALLKLKEPKSIDEESLKLALSKVYDPNNSKDVISVLLSDTYNSDSLKARSKAINESVYSDDLKEQAISNIDNELKQREYYQKEEEKEQRENNNYLKLFGILILIVILSVFAIVYVPDIVSAIKILIKDIKE